MPRHRRVGRQAAGYWPRPIWSRRQCFSEKAFRKLALSAARAYREHMAELAVLPRPLLGTIASTTSPRSHRLSIIRASIICRTRQAFASYAKTLQDDRRVLLHHHTLGDVAFKAVGVGSVGTFCAIGLLTAGDASPLLLQIKEVQESVLGPSAGASAYPNHGERVVVGSE
jgi:hypothetical protein